MIECRCLQAPCYRKTSPEPDRHRLETHGLSHYYDRVSVFAGTVLYKDFT